MPAAVPNKTTKRAHSREPERESAIRVSIPISFRLAQTAESSVASLRGSVVAVLRDKLFVLFFYFLCVPFLLAVIVHAAPRSSTQSSILFALSHIQCRQRMLSRHSEREHLPRLSVCYQSMPRSQ